jgi:hypothetical protein
MEVLVLVTCPDCHGASSECFLCDRRGRVQLWLPYADLGLLGNQKFLILGRRHSGTDEAPVKTQAFAHLN